MWLWRDKIILYNPLIWRLKIWLSGGPSINFHNLSILIYQIRVKLVPL